MAQTFKTFATPASTIGVMTTAIDLQARGTLPPGPASPFWGIPLLRAMRADYLGFTAALQRDHGDVVFMRLGIEKAVDVFDPELVRHLLVEHAADLVRWERGVEVFAQLFGQSVLVTEGETWQRQRRMLHPAFTPRRVAGYAGLMRDAATERLDTAVPPGHAEAEVQMDELFSHVAMDVILRTLFSSRIADDARQAIAATQVLSENALREMFWPATLPDWLPLPGKAAKRHAMRSLRELVGRHIRQRQQQPPTEPSESTDTGDLLAMLLSLRDETSGEALTAAEVFDQCMVSFQAGHETSATALLWWSRLLAEHPAAAQRAQQEVDAVLAGRAPGPQDLQALPWLTATLKEAMRLYPPIAAVMTRRATQPIRLGRWTVAPGTLIRITPSVLHRDPRSFERPDDFVPERFLPDAPTPPRGAWMPFGTGPRVCIGQHFAMLEMVLVAALLLQRYTLALPEGALAPCRPVLNVTLRPEGGVRLKLARRATPVNSGGPR